MRGLGGVVGSWVHYKAEEAEAEEQLLLAVNLAVGVLDGARRKQRSDDDDDYRVKKTQ